MISKMAMLSVAQGHCSALLPTVHGCHYAFQKFPFFMSLCIIVSMMHGHTNIKLSFIIHKLPFVAGFYLPLFKQYVCRKQCAEFDVSTPAG